MLRFWCQVIRGPIHDHERFRGIAYNSPDERLSTPQIWENILCCQHVVFGDGDEYSDNDSRARAETLNLPAFGHAALHAAILHSVDLVHLLISYGADTKVTDNAGKTPLHWLPRSQVEFVSTC